MFFAKKVTGFGKGIGDDKLINQSCNDSEVLRVSSLLKPGDRNRILAADKIKTIWDASTRPTRLG